MSRTDFSGSNPFYRHQQPIALPANGFDVLGVIGRIAQCLPQLLDGGVDAVIKLDHGIVGPQIVPDFLPADEPSVAVHQHTQDTETLILEDYTAIALPQFARSEIDVKDTEPHPIWQRVFHVCGIGWS